MGLYHDDAPWILTFEERSEELKDRGFAARAGMAGMYGLLREGLEKHACEECWDGLCSSEGPGLGLAFPGAGSRSKGRRGCRCPRRGSGGRPGMVARGLIGFLGLGEFWISSWE